MLLLLVLIGGAMILGISWLISTYNTMVFLKNQVDNTWHQIDTELKRRSDLIPRLVETVKGYAEHEKETLIRVIEARSGLNTAQTEREKNEADNALTGALKSLFAVAENYPALKADQNFLAFQQELTFTENRINMVRQQYNDAVSIYNSRIESFPANLLVGLWSFSPREYFMVDRSDRQAPEINF